MFVTYVSSPASVGLTAWFALIIEGLCGAVAARAPRHLKAPLLVMVYGRLRRLVARFERMVERATSGAVPVRRVRAPRASGAARTGRRWPDGFAWLVQLVPEAAAFGCQLQHLLLQPQMVALIAAAAAAFGCQLQHLLLQPQMVALIAAAPQEGRMFGPLGRMLAVQMGPDLSKRGKVRAAAPERTPPANLVEPVQPGVARVVGAEFAGKIVPDWARNAWPGHDFAGRDPPARSPKTIPKVDRSD